MNYFVLNGYYLLDFLNYNLRDKLNYINILFKIRYKNSIF